LLTAVASQRGSALQRGSLGLVLATLAIHIVEYVGVFHLLKLVKLQSPSEHFVDTLLFGYFHWRKLLPKRD